MTQQLVDDMLRELNPDQPEGLFYFSFADGTRPTGQQFLGGLYIRGKSMTGALQRSHQLGLNPGGEVMMFEVPADLAALIRLERIGRLLSRAELEQMDREGNHG